MYNKKVLIESLKKLGSAKAPTQKKDVVVGLNNPTQMSSMKQGGSSVDKQLSVKKSNIQGNGLFINEPIRKGDVIGLAHINNQATPIVGKNHNHSENNPTAVNISQGNKRYLVAAKDLPAGTEITTNYRLQPELEQPEDFMRNGGMTPQKDGYRTYSPYKNLPYIDIHTDTIDTDNIVYDLQLVANNGVTKNVQKNTGLHKIPGASVIREIPIDLEKQSFKKGGGPGDRWLASLVKQGTRSNNLLTYPVKLAGERIARLNAMPYRTKQDIIDALFKKGYEANYFGNADTLHSDSTYGFGKRDLIANYFRGIDTGFEPTDYDFDSDAGLEALINEYGPLKAYLMNSQVKNEEPLSARDLMYHRVNKAYPHSDYDYPNIKIRDHALSKNFLKYTWQDYDADETKENFHKLFDSYGKETIPFDIQPDTSKPPPLFSFKYSPVNPIDNVAGHMGLLQRTAQNEFQLTTRDSWGFFPKNYDPKWNMSDKFRQKQTQLMDAFGKPFILTQTNPITFKKGGVHKTKNKNSRSYSRSLDATNKFFAENYLFEKPSSRKNKIYDPHAKYYQEGGASSPEKWEQEIRGIEGQIGNPTDWTMNDYYLLQDKLNAYRDWRENTPEGQAVIDSHNEEGEYNIPLPEHLQDYTNAMMKSKLAYANEFGNPAAKRMINLPDNPYQFDNGDTGTHYMASMDNYAVPQIQDENGQLVLGDYDPSSKEAMRFDSDEDARYFAEHYKDIAPGFINAKLTSNEIEEYAKGGYIIEDISVPELDKAQEGLEQTVTDTDKDYLIRMANSPLFKERYARMVGKPIDQVGEEAEAYRQQILNNIETVKINDIGVLPKDQISFEELKAKGFYSPPLSKESELFKPYYDSVNNTSLNKKEKKYYSEQFDEILNDFNKDKHSVYLNTDNPWTRTHELSHASVMGSVDKIFADPIKFKPYETPPKDQFNKLIEDIMVTNKPYLENPDEQKARVDVARKYLESKGLYDPVNENFTEEHLKKLQESMNFRDSDIAPQLIDLMLPYETKDKLRLFNDFVEKKPNQNSNIVKAEQGGELDKAQKGKPVQPYYTSDRKDFIKRIDALADSMGLYNQGLHDRDNYVNYLNKNGFDAKNHLERWNTNGWVDTDVHPTIGAIYNGILENSGGGFSRDNKGVAHSYTTYPLKNGNSKNVYDESPEGKLLAKRYSVYKKPVEEVIFVPNNNTIKKTLTAVPTKVKYTNKKNTITNVNAVPQDPVIPQEEVTPLARMPYQEVTRPELQIIPAAPYVKPVHYAGPRFGRWSDGSKGQFPQGLNTSDWERKTKEHQEQQRSAKPIVTRKYGGILDKAQTGLQVAGKNIIKNIVNYNEGDLLRLLAYKGINPASYRIKEKITQMPGELYNNTVNNSNRPFRTGMGLRYGPRNELLDQLLTQLNTSKASWNKLSTKDKMGALDAYDPLLMKTLEDIGQRRLDAWAVGLGQQQEYNTLEQIGENTYKMLGIEHTPDFFSERNNDIIFHGLKDQKYDDIKDQLINLSKQHYDLSKHPLTKRETEYHKPWQQTYHVQSSPKSDFIHSIYDNDTYGVRGGYRWDMKDTPEGMHWQANDVWDLHPWEKRSSGIINQSDAAKYYLGETFFKPLQNVEALGLIGGKSFNIENNFLVDPKTFKTIKQWEKGGEMEYELGDEIDEATKRKLEKLGYTFEII